MTERYTQEELKEYFYEALSMFNEVLDTDITPETVVNSIPNKTYALSHEFWHEEKSLKRIVFRLGLSFFFCAIFRAAPVVSSVMTHSIHG